MSGWLRRLIFADPVAWLPGRVRTWSKFTACTGGDAAQLRILLPEVGVNEFRGCEKLQNGGIASG